MMRGPMIETEARAILNQGIRQGINQGINETSARKIKMAAEIEEQIRIANRMIQAGKLTIEEIAEYTELKVEEVEQLAGDQTI